MFFLIALGILSLIYGYAGWRFLAPLRLSLLWSLVSWGGVVALMILPVLVIRLREHALPGWLYVPLAWIAYLGLGFATLAFSLLAIRDLVWIGGLVLDKLFRLTGLYSTTGARTMIPVDPNRRQLLLNGLNLGLLSASALLTAGGALAARDRLKVFAIKVPIAGLPASLEGFRIVQISDIHAGLTIGRDFVQRLVDRIEPLAPDLIALTGDMIDGEVDQLREHVAPLGQLSAPCGCFFVTGNHEYYNRDPVAWIAEARRLGFDVLLNEHRLIRHGDGRILVAGVTDYNAGEIMPEHASDPEAALADAPPSDFRLLLAHQPRSIFAAARAGCDLQLSGHTHGGQFIPWKYFISLQQPFIAGLHRQGQTWIYVNRGAGYWGPPLRLGAPAELTLLTLTRTGKEA